MKDFFRKLFGEPAPTVDESVSFARYKTQSDLLGQYRTALTQSELDNLRKRQELRMVNRAIARRNRTIERLRKRLVETLPELPESARTKDGKAIYSRGYVVGRRRGRLDVLEAMSKMDMNTNVVDAAAEIADEEAPLPNVEATANGGEYGREHAH